MVGVCASYWVDDSTLQSMTRSRVQTQPRTFVLDLDKDPKDRWTALAQDPVFENYKKDFTNYVGSYIPKAALPIITDITRSLKGKFYPDYADEMIGLADALGVSIGDVVLANLIYQVEGIGRACEAGNTTGPCPPKAAGPGMCTAIVGNGQDSLDGSGIIWQGRNLDWNLDATLLKYVLRVEYKRQNKTIFTGVQIAGEIGVLHGLRKGAFSVQLNARDQGGNFLNNLGQIVLGLKTPTHVMRYALEHEDTFEHALEFLSTTHLANPAYFVMAGIQDREGAILTRDRKELVDVWHLFEAPSMDTQGINLQPDWFRLQTNFDHWTEVPDDDNRRTPGVANMAAFCADGVNRSCVMQVLTTWPTQNHHTDVTSVMCPKTGHIDVTVWVPPSHVV